MVLCSFLIAPALLAGIHHSSAQEARYFRISGPAPSAIIAFLPDGSIVWSNALPDTNYIVQTVRATPAGTDWVHYVQLPVTHSVNTNRLIAFNPPSGMALVPAGSFSMGDSLDLDPQGVPVHTVYVSGSYMDQSDVTEALWQRVYDWATNHGYSFDNPGSVNNQFTKGPDHPVVDVDWYDCVKWCNARSEMAGLTPAYYTGPGQSVVYRSGDMDISSSWVHWDGNGYRLPTEAEWEKAARGGPSGQRFPWGDTISEGRANYNAEPNPLNNGGYTFDLGPYSGFNTNFDTGTFPHTSPINYFAPNGYGLYDMAGNVFQWCWDYYDQNWYSNTGAVANDTRGPTSSPYNDRVTRGGSWEGIANYARCASRYSDSPSRVSYELGFRCVRGLLNWPAGMVLVPAGSFSMGDSGASPLSGVHAVYVSGFYMDRYDVTEALWSQVYDWATNHGFSFSSPGSVYDGHSKGLHNPLVDVNWYDAVKWCNARSAMAGLTPAYYTDPDKTMVYRTGQADISSACVNWNGGYRLPTEAEWEKAARGGLSGQRFPLGDTISESQANYFAKPDVFSYDVSSYTAFNTNFDVGGYPYTSPVTYFPPNGYGLCDMAGNVWQWCWDWYDPNWYLDSEAATDNTRGPASPPPPEARVERGGGWGNDVSDLGCAYRSGLYPGSSETGIGFRCVRAAPISNAKSAEGGGQGPIPTLASSS